MTKTVKEKQYLSWKVQLKNGQNYNFGSLSFKRLITTNHKEGSSTNVKLRQKK